MTDLKIRFAELDTVPVPDLMGRVEAALDTLDTAPTPLRAAAPPAGPDLRRGRYAVATMVAVFVGTLVLIGGLVWLVGSRGQSSAPADLDTSPPTTTASPQPSVAPDNSIPTVDTTLQTTDSTAQTTTITTPVTSAPAPPQPEPMTTADLRAVFDDPAMWSEELRESYLGNSFQAYLEVDGHVFKGLEVGSTIAFDAELLDGGAFSTEELAGRPALIVAWYGEPGSLEPDGGWRQVHENLTALQTVHENFGDRLGVVSVFIPYSGEYVPDRDFYVSISEQLARNGYTFPVVVAPTTPDGTPMTAFADLSDGMPAWVLIDDSGGIIDGFLGYVAPIPVAFLLAELGA